jgi:hypothetical protein
MLTLFLTAGQAVLAGTTLNNLDVTAKQGGVKPATDDLPTIIGNVIGTVLSFVGVIFFLLVLYAGMSWMLAMGKEEKITQAKDMLFAAVIGLIVVLAAYAITNVVARIFGDVSGVK